MPRFIRDIVADPPPLWSVGPHGERLMGRVIRCGQADVGELTELLFTTMRRLPIIVVSTLDDAVLGGDLDDRVERDLRGLAHVVRLTSDGAWELTNRTSRGWSCFNGAVRLFWPRASLEGDFRRHPLFTHDRMLRMGATEAIARDAIRDVIRRIVIDASTVVPDDTAIRRFEADSLRRAADEARATAERDGDYRQLAEVYAKENDVLQASLASRDRT